MTPGVAMRTGLGIDVTVRRGGFSVSAAFDARPGETIALVGPNGSGKSTLVSTLAGLERPSAGRIALDGEVLDDVPTGVHVAPEHRRIGVVFQDLLLFPHLSARENVAFGPRARGSDRADAHRRAAAALERLGLGSRLDARPRDLSGGQAQRVALARALIVEPRLLLLDEPLSALDVGARAEVRDAIRDELSRFDGVRILVTHDPVEAAILADRLVVLEAGHVTQIGTPDEIRGAPHTRYAADLVGVNAFRGRLRRSPDGSGVVETPAGDVIVPWPDERAPGDEVIAIVRPTDVTLSREPPAGSARNVFRGEIRSVAIEGDRARVRLATVPPLVAEITRASVERLGLRAGVTVSASFKAVEVDVLTP